MQITYTKCLAKKERKFFQSQVKRAFIRFLAYKGDFDPYIPPLDLKELKAGHLPQWLNVHHVHPLSGGGSNEFSNLKVISKAYHIRINKDYYDPQLLGIKEGETRVIDVPELKGNVIIPELLMKKNRYRSR